MAQLTRAEVEELTNQEATVLINEHGLAEGSAAEQKQALLEHFGLDHDD